MFQWNEPAQNSAFFKIPKSQKSISKIKIYSSNVELAIDQSYVAKMSTFRVVKPFGGPFASHWKKPMMSRNWWKFLKSLQVMLNERKQSINPIFNRQLSSTSGNDSFVIAEDESERENPELSHRWINTDSFPSLIGVYKQPSGPWWWCFYFLRGCLWNKVWYWLGNVLLVTNWFNGIITSVSKIYSIYKLA